MLEIFYLILPVFIMPMIGLITKKWLLPSEQFWRKIENLCYFILMPITFTHSTYSSELNIIDNYKIILCAIVIAFITYMFLKITLRIETDTNQEVYYASVIQSILRPSTYIFLTLAYLTLDTKYFAKAITLIASMNIMWNIIYVGYINVQNNNSFLLILMKIIGNPLIISCMIGFIMKGTHLIISDPILSIVTTISKMALITGSMIIGSKLINIDKIFSVQLCIQTLLYKTLLIPGMMFILLNIFDINDTSMRLIGMLYSVVPASSSSYFLCQQITNNQEAVINITAVSMISSILPICFIVSTFA